MLRQSFVCGISALQLSFSVTMPPKQAIERVRSILFQKRRKQDVSLSLRDRIRVIEAYKIDRSYESLSSKFNCSVNEVKNIHRRGKQRACADYVRRNVKKSLGFKLIKSENDALVVTFLNKILFEWFKRAQKRPEMGIITNQLILKMGEEASRMLPFKNFIVEMDWVLDFRRQYNITDLDMNMLMIKPDENKWVSLDILEIAVEVVDELLKSEPIRNHPSESDGSSEIEFVVPDIENPQHPNGTETAAYDSDESNVLSLRSRVLLMKAYKHEPSYKKLAKRFNCNIIEVRKVHRRGRARVYSEYIKTRSKEYLNFKIIKSENDYLVLPLLEELVYEWVQRAQRHAQNGTITNELLLLKAEEAKHILPIKNLYLDLEWVLHFRRKYNITDLDMAMLRVGNDNEPVDLDMYEIAFYVLDKLDPPIYPADLCADTEIHIDRDEQNSNSAMEWSRTPDGEAELIGIDDEELPPIQKDEEVQRYLKPLEDYALIKENYRAIGLIEQLRDVLKNDEPKVSLLD